MDRLDLIKDICRRMEDLCADAGLVPFDRVRFASDPDEVWFVWEEQKRVVVIELDADPAAMAATLAKASAGDPTFN